MSWAIPCWLVNGAIQPFHEVGTRKYRYRILNGSNARRYELALSNNDAFIQIGTDGGLLGAPVAKSTITLAPAERVDVVIDFANVAVGTEIVLENLWASLNGCLWQSKLAILPNCLGMNGVDYQHSLMLIVNARLLFPALRA